MTSETAKDKPATGGSDQRPHATLDLKAKEILTGDSPKKPANAQAALPPGASAPSEPKMPPPPPPPSDPVVGARAGDTGGGGGFLSHMAAGLVGAALALGGFMFLGQRTGDDEALRRALTSAEQRIGALETSTRTASGGIEARLKDAADQAGALRQEIAAVSGRLNAVEGRPATAAAPSPESVQESLAPLSARVGQIEARLGDIAKSQNELRASTGEAALTMAVQNLRRAVDEGKPFATELKTLASLAPGPFEAAPLEARRDKGLASLARLQQEFDASAKAALDAARPNGNGSFTGDLLARARNLVRVRPTGDIPGDAPEAVLARAEHRLDDGDLAAAIREAGQLAGPAAEAMTGWLNEARAKAAADEALARLEARLTSLGPDEGARRGG